ncbi:MAG: 50S ribosomal protein L18e [Methanobacteriaceae archaeon]|nr:50S ribosomal protein L18e [Methanobacteriaceae archaeon]
MKTNPQLNQLIKILKEKAYQEQTPLWKDLARRLEKPTRNQAEVNISRINRHTSEDEIVLVPGKVLGSGSLDHKVQVAALDFSKQAEEKIKSAGGKCLDINLLMEENPQGSRIRIIE